MKNYFYQIIILVSAIILWTIPTNAQIKSNAGIYDDGIRPKFADKDNYTPEDKAKMVTQKMKKELNLSNDTAKLIYQINLATETEFAEQLKNSPNMTEYDKAMLKKIRSNNTEEIKKVLTADQWAKYQYLQEERKRKFEEQKLQRMNR